MKYFYYINENTRLSILSKFLHLDVKEQWKI